jgi:hypothetical protein
MKFVKILVAPVMATMFISLFNNIGSFTQSDESYYWTVGARPVKGAPDPRFPVLLVFKEPKGLRAEVVYFESLNYATTDKPKESWSFLVPQEEIKNVERQVANMTYARQGVAQWDDQHPYSASVQVEELKAGKQRITVDWSWDDDVSNQSTYEASSHEFTPLTRERGRAQSMMLVVPLWVLCVFVSYWILGLVIKSPSKRL